MKFSNTTRVLLIVGTFLFAGGFFWVINPTESPFVPPCLLHYTTGLYCPGCGTGRSLFFLFHGHFYSAFAMNPLLIVTMPFLIWMVFNPPWMRKVWPLWMIFGIFLGYTIARNIPCKPFNYLAPGGLLHHWHQETQFELKSGSSPMSESVLESDSNKTPSED